MREYERACACCKWRFCPSGEELYCGPCGRARVLPEYPQDALAAVFDKDFARYSGHVCPLLWTAEEQRLVETTMRRWQAYTERELRDRWPDTQRDDWEQQ